jgi:very-short-patch-repair endonuclease
VGSTLTCSELEECFLVTCRKHRLPPPEVNVVIEGYEVDFVWRKQRLVVETDGHAAHGTRRAFERDRVRDLELTAARWRVVRVTHGRLMREADAVAKQLARLL